MARILGERAALQGREKKNPQPFVMLSEVRRTLSLPKGTEDVVETSRDPFPPPCCIREFYQIFNLRILVRRGMSSKVVVDNGHPVIFDRFLLRSALLSKLEWN
jgi:hypothetical protein